MDRIRLVVLCFVLTLIALPMVAQDSIEVEDAEIFTHKVQPGDNLYRIALRYGLTMGEIAEANEIVNWSRIYVGQEIVIPGMEAVDSSDDVVNPLVAAEPTVHVVARGETLNSIAQQYGVTIDEILAANQIANINRIFAGDELNIWATDISVTDEAAVIESTEELPASTASPTEDEIASHVVQPGESLVRIAQRYGIPWTEVAAANNLTNPNRISYGMTLEIPGIDPAVAAILNQSGGVLSDVPTLAERIEPPGAKVGVGRELVVDLSTQMSYAYEDGVLQYAALVSTGLPATPTVRGSYKIYHKTPAQTMSGPGYYLPNVEWVMYFYHGYGFHGTYWHNNFGQPMSHGCVNMRNEDAQWFYEFASIGTPVWVQV